MLERGRGLLTPGGTLVFCTCSLEPEEGERRISPRAIAVCGRSRIEPGELGGLAEAVTPEGGGAHPAQPLAGDRTAPRRARWLLHPA